MHESALALGVVAMTAVMWAAMVSGRAMVWAVTMTPVVAVAAMAEVGAAAAEIAAVAVAAAAVVAGKAEGVVMDAVAMATVASMEGLERSEPAYWTMAQPFGTFGSNRYMTRLRMPKLSRSHHCLQQCKRHHPGMCKTHPRCQFQVRYARQHSRVIVLGTLHSHQAVGHAIWLSGRTKSQGVRTAIRARR